MQKRALLVYTVCKRENRLRIYRDLERGRQAASSSKKEMSEGDLIEIWERFERDETVEVSSRIARE